VLARSPGAGDGKFAHRTSKSRAAPTKPASHFSSSRSLRYAVVSRLSASFATPVRRATTHRKSIASRSIPPAKGARGSTQPNAGCGAGRLSRSSAVPNPATAWTATFSPVGPAMLCHARRHRLQFPPAPHMAGPFAVHNWLNPPRNNRSHCRSRRVLSNLRGRSAHARTADTIAATGFPLYPLRIPSDRDEELGVAEEAF
jgi:hypothetical protein